MSEYESEDSSASNPGSKSKSKSISYMSLLLGQAMDMGMTHPKQTSPALTLRLHPV